jgi:hypothetical protein
MMPLQISWLLAVWEALVEEDGYEEACRLQSRAGNNNGAGNKR